MSELETAQVEYNQAKDRLVKIQLKIQDEKTRTREAKVMVLDAKYPNWNEIRPPLSHAITLKIEKGYGDLSSLFEYLWMNPEIQDATGNKCYSKISYDGKHDDDYFIEHIGQGKLDKIKKALAPLYDAYNKIVGTVIVL